MHPKIEATKDQVARSRIRELIPQLWILAGLDGEPAMGQDPKTAQPAHKDAVRALELEAFSERLDDIAQALDAPVVERKRK